MVIAAALILAGIGPPALKFEHGSIEVKNGAAVVVTRLVNRSKRRLRIYPPIYSSSVDVEWTLPKAVDWGPVVVLRTPSYAAYEERWIAPGESITEICEVKLPAFQPPRASFRAEFRLRYSSEVARFYHLDLRWPGPAPYLAKAELDRMWVDLIDGQIVRAGRG